MSRVFQIQIAALSNDESVSFDEEVASDFLEVTDSEISFDIPIAMQGKAYLADDHLIIQVQIQLQASMPCSICNEKAPSSIQLKNHYITKPLSEIKDHFFDFSDELRQAILLELPAFAECENGSCPKREEVKKYYKETKDDSESTEETYFPFEDLENHFKNEG